MSQLEVSTTPRLAPAPVETGVANRTRRWLPDIAGVTVVLAILGYYWARFGHLFPQVEFIDWISWPARPIITDGLRDMFTFADDGGFTRHVPLMYAAALGRVCGGNATCVNAMVFLPLLVGAPAFYALGRLLGLGAAAATGVVVVTLISQPTFDVLVWQATLLDRMALAAVPVMMILVYVAVRHTRLSWRYVVPWAVGLSVLGLLTLNIKEPAWVMAPLVVLAPVLLARDRREARAAAVTLAAPLVVMIVHLTTNLAAVWASPAYRKHVAEGSITDNLSTLTRFVIPGGLPVLIVAALLGVAGVALAVRARRTVPEAFTVARAAVWVGVAAVVGWIIPLRTEFAVPFYMLVPLATAALALALALRAGQLALARVRPSVLRYAGVAFGVVLVAWCAGVAVGNRWEPYGQRLVLNDGFRSSLPRIEAVHAAHPGKAILFTAPDPNLAGRWVSAAVANRFWRFAGGATAADHGYPVGATTSICGDGTTAVVIRLDAELRMTGSCPH